MCLLAFQNDAKIDDIAYFSVFLSTEALEAASIAGASWLMLTALMQFILSEVAGFVLGLVFAVILFILPIVNHIQIFSAIRRHNNQVHDEVSGQNLSALFAREKEVAIDMFIVIAVLLLFLAPALIVNIFGGLLGDLL